MSENTELRLDGELTIYRAAEIRQALREALEPASRLRIDLAGVSEADSVGIQLLIAAKKAAMAGGKTLELANHSTSVLAMFELYDLAGFFGDPLLMPAATH